MTYNNKYRGNIFSRFSSISEASASELLEIIEEKFPRYYIRSDLVCSNLQPHNSVLPVTKRLNNENNPTRISGTDEGC